MKPEFTKSERLQLIGLQTVAQSLWKQIYACPAQRVTER